MRRQLALSAALACLAAASLAGKVAASQRYGTADETRLANDMTAMLEGHGFRAAPLRHHLFQPVRAEKGRCRLLAANIAAAGYMDRRFAIEAAPYGQVRYHYRGRETGALPRWLPVAEEYLQKWVYRVGLSVPRPPIIAVAASRECDGQALPWKDARIWPRLLRSGPATAA